jgi:hypothetical protein
MYEGFGKTRVLLWVTQTTFTTPLGVSAQRVLITQQLRFRGFAFLAA